MYGICVEASHERGMGHLFRAINLASYLNKFGINYILFINKFPPSENILQKKFINYAVYDNNKANWQIDLALKYRLYCWIDDRLDTSYSHSMLIKKSGTKLISFDNHGSGATLSDINIIPVLNPDTDKALGIKILSGKDYIIFSDDVFKNRRLRSQNKRILITLGGSDNHNILRGLLEIYGNIKTPTTIILGPGHDETSIKKSCHSLNLTIKKNVPSLAEEFYSHDLAITAGGLTPFEASASGLPCFIITAEPFEIKNALFLEKLGCSKYLGHLKVDKLDSILNIVDMHLYNMSLHGLNSFDDKAGIRIIEEIESLR